VFFLDDEDMKLVGKHRGEHMRAGFALQLVTVRWLGTFLEDPLDVPGGVLDFVAGQQLGMTDPSTVKRYTEREHTRFEHQWEGDQEGPRLPGVRRRRGGGVHAVGGGQARATGDGPKAIFADGLAWLRERDILLRAARAGRGEDDKVGRAVQVRAVGVQGLVPEAVPGAEGPGAGGFRLDGLQDGDRLVAAADGDLSPPVGGSLPANLIDAASRRYPAVSLGACHEVREFHEFTVGAAYASRTPLPGDVGIRTISNAPGSRHVRRAQSQAGRPGSQARSVEGTCCKVLVSKNYSTYNSYSYGSPQL
jgi:hypothetical protein